MQHIFISNYSATEIKVAHLCLVKQILHNKKKNIYNYLKMESSELQTFEFENMTQWFANDGKYLTVDGDDI